MAIGSEGETLQKVAAVRADIVALLREKRYEETLAALYRARSEAPGDRELQKSIDQIKEFLVGTYAKRLGGLDRVAAPLPVSAPRSPDVVMLGRYVDGVSTYADIAQMCPLGQLRTLQVLVGVYCGVEPPRISGIDAPRAEPPNSGFRTHDEAPTAPSAEIREASRAEPDASPPDTARSRSIGTIGRVLETEEDRRYKETFAQGTAFFVQRRFTDAAEAFETCLKLRPRDRAAEVMFRRSLAQGESR
ncbi:MAG TPA: TRP-like protein [Polyangiaceae bacterium]|nr:TRP-like protein [Polyangiaceae bacterium]